MLCQSVDTQTSNMPNVQQTDMIELATYSLEKIGHD